MIKQVLIDGVSVTNDYTFLSRVRDSANAISDVQSYSRGGRSGITLGHPFYRGFVIQLEFTVIGKSSEQLLEQRDRLANFFRLRTDKTVEQTRTLGFVMADNSVRVVPAIFSPYVGSINSQDTTKSVVQITCQTELEYLTSSVDLTQRVDVADLGGFEIPFGVPFAMDNTDDLYQEPGGEVVIENKGNSEFYPQVTFTGSLNIINLINDTTGKTFTYSEELQEDEELVIDMYNRTAVKDNITNSLADVSGTWWWLEPGFNAIRLTSGGGTGNAVITYRHAYRGI